MSLTSEQVDSIADELVNRANAAIAKLESSKSLLGSLTGNNDTIEQSEGALRNTISQIGPWKTRGEQLADAELAADAPDDTAAVAAWQSAGQAFTTSISEIDGYGESASLEAVIGQTATQTAKDVGNGAAKVVKGAASFLPWWTWPVVGVLVVFYIFVRAKR